MLVDKNTKYNVIPEQLKFLKDGIRILDFSNSILSKDRKCIGSFTGSKVSSLL